MNKETKTIDLKAIKKVINYGTEARIEGLLQYIKDMENYNKLLLGFTFLEKLSDLLSQKYAH
jgi:hypothetical protein